jgi:phage replication-related protein YjqB (UPF0714/DUF867 family)
MRREPDFAWILRLPEVDESYAAGPALSLPAGAGAARAVSRPPAAGSHPGCIFAPHGGGIEPGTEEIARALARASGASLYVLAGRRAAGNKALHVTSTAMRAGVSARLDRALARCRTAIAIHGHAQPGAPRAIYVSGRAAAAAGLISAALRGALAGWDVIDDPARIPPGLAGLSPENFVNRPAGGGVQIELPRALRDEARPAPRGQALVLVGALARAVATLATAGPGRAAN